MRVWRAMVGVCAAWAASGACVVRGDPPRVVRAVPDHADVAVDPALGEIRITFDQEMSPHGHSLCGGGPEFPPIAAPPRWADARTFVVPVSLEAGRAYRLSVNCPAARNFHSAAGEPADAYPIAFRTARVGEAAPRLAEGRAAEMAAALRRAVDERYALRDRRGVDWEARFEAWRARLEGAKTPAAFARAAAGLLAANDDLHTSVHVNGFTLATGRRSVAPNVDAGLLARTVPGWAEFPGGAAGRFKDGIGYLAIHTLGDGLDLERALAALEPLALAPGLVLDVRMNAGGDERLARRIAACFVEERRVYALSQVRDPEAEGGWAGPFERLVEPAPDGPRFAGRVAVLMGPACMSSCESFLLMLREPGRREWFGARTWGSSGNPRPVDLGEGVTVYLSSWWDMTPGWAPIEGRGLLPDHPVGWPGEPWEDPVLEAALAWLRAGEPAR